MLVCIWLRCNTAEESHSGMPERQYSGYVSDLIRGKIRRPSPENVDRDTLVPFLIKQQQRYFFF